MLYVTRIEPFTPPPAPDAPACASAEACVASCPDGSVDCVLSCDDADMGCVACAVVGGWDCAGTCFAPFAMVEDCARSCFESGALLGGNVGACFKAECGAAYDSVLSCMDDKIADGACDTQLAECGIDL